MEERRNKTPKQIRADAFSFWKAKKREATILTISFFLVAFCCIGLGFIAPIILVLTIPFLLLPFCFACQHAVFDLGMGNDFTNQSLWFGFRGYFRGYFGVYRVFVTFLKCLLVYFVISFLISMPFVYFASINDAGFKDAFNQLNTMLSDQGTSYQTIYKFLENNYYMRTTMNVTSLPSFCFAFLFLGFVFKENLLNIFIRSSAEETPVTQVNKFFAYCLRSYRKSILKEIVLTLFPSLIGSLVGMGVSIALYFVLNISPFLALPVILSGFVCGAIPFMVYTFRALELIFINHRLDFSMISITRAESLIEDLKSRNVISPEDENEMREKIKEAKEKLKEEFGEKESDENGN